MATESEIRTLTGLRGIAAMMVVVYHFQQIPPGTPGLYESFINHGYLYVDLFFVLSGFVMAYSYGKMFAGTPTWRSYRAFLVRRIARVYPIYLLTTLAYFLIFYFNLTRHAGAIPDPVGTLGWNLAMMQTWMGIPSFNSPAWSISVEWGAYLLFPLLLAVTVTGPRWQAAAVCALSFTALVAMGHILPAETVARIVGPLDITTSAGFPLLRCLSEFCLGLVTYRVAMDPASRTWTANAVFPAAAWLAFVALMAVPGTDVLVVATFPLLLVSLVHGTGPVPRFFASPVVHALGAWSYSIYLLHWRFVSLPGALAARLPEWGGMGRVVALVACMALTVALAAITYRLVEKPARGLIRALATAEGRGSLAKALRPAGGGVPRQG